MTEAPRTLLAALGSSYAAGPGLPPVVDAAAMRSGANYPHLLADLLGARLVDLSVSGATTATILTTPQRTLRGTRFAPQVDGVPADADIVTITAGGNDLGHIGGMLRLALLGRLHDLPLVGRLVRPATPPTVDAAAVADAAAGLVLVVEGVRDRAPGARVVLVDYLTAVGPHTTPGPSTPFTTEQLAGLRTVAEQLAAAFATAARASGADLVSVSTHSADHGLGSPQPWVTGFQPLRGLASSFHPNAEGMRAVADRVFRHLTG